jgi:hypothetical protein
VRLTTPRFSGRGSPPAIGVLSAGYWPLGSGPRAAGWSAATLCCGPSLQMWPHTYLVAIGAIADMPDALTHTPKARMTQLRHYGPRISNGGDDDRHQSRPCAFSAPNKRGRVPPKHSFEGMYPELIYLDSTPARTTFGSDIARSQRKRVGAT